MKFVRTAAAGAGHALHWEEPARFARRSRIRRQPRLSEATLQCQTTRHRHASESGTSFKRTRTMKFKSKPSPACNRRGTDIDRLRYAVAALAHKASPPKIELYRPGVAYAGNAEVRTASVRPPLYDGLGDMTVPVTEEPPFDSNVKTGSVRYRKKNTRNRRGSCRAPLPGVNRSTSIRAHGLQALGANRCRAGYDHQADRAGDDRKPFARDAAAKAQRLWREMRFS
jgi:hypothetical protein